jgi:hypothetical protein
MSKHKSEDYKLSAVKYYLNNDISLDDPTIKQAFTSLNSEGQPITKPLWEFEKELRRDERWRFTKNAQQDLMGTARKVLSDFGLVY